MIGRRVAVETSEGKEYQGELVGLDDKLNLVLNDVSGAGDSLLAALSVGLCSNASLMESSAIGAGMAALAVQQIGNIPISNQQLKDYLKKL